MKNSDNTPTTARRPKWWKFKAYIIYIFSAPKWIGMQLKYHGKMHTVINETFDSVQLKENGPFINKRNWKKINDEFNRK